MLIVRWLNGKGKIIKPSFRSVALKAQHLLLQLDIRPMSDCSSMSIVIGMEKPTIVRTRKVRRDPLGMGFRQKKGLRLFASVLMESATKMVGGSYRLLRK